VSRRAAARVVQGHPWVFANDVTADLKEYDPGEVVSVLDPGGRALGTGYVNPRALIAVRLVDRAAAVVDRIFLEERIRHAATYRARVLDDVRHARLVFGESDQLPGVVVDRFGEVLVVQLLTAGADRWEADLLDVLEAQTGARTIVLANDSAFRELEGLERGRRVARGELPAEIHVEEGGLRFLADLAGGQKTGWYYDQRDNRRAFADRVGEGARVLDLFCYTGSWAIAAAARGATAIGRDSSEAALALATANAELNGVAARTRFEREDLLTAGEVPREEREAFDAVVLDPPPLARNRKSRPSALRAMVRLTRDAVIRVRRGGLLVACSCSHHLGAADLAEAVAIGAAKAGRRLRVIHRGGQAPDHPILPAAPETEYLHALFLDVE
jgi:23S rRNA (cytosine1962-C5)-methyltransferase